MTSDRIIAVGLLSQRDLDVLGKGFQRAYPVDRDDMFGDLLAALDKVQGVPEAGLKATRNTKR